MNPFNFVVGIFLVNLVCTVLNMLTIANGLLALFSVLIMVTCVITLVGLSKEVQE